MNKSENIELVVTDLDGTLIHDRKMHPKDKKSAEKVISSGIPIIPATTRMRYSSAKLIQDLPICDYPIICQNGARVVGPGWGNGYDHKDWHETRLEYEIAEPISRYADERDYAMTTVFKEKKYWVREGSQNLGKHPHDEAAWIVKKNSDALKDGLPVNFMIHDDRNSLEGMRDLLNYVKYNFNNQVRIDKHHRLGKWMALTVYPSGTSKLNALKVVCDRLDISMENILAIGDDEVDYELIKEAGIGIAMGDAPEEVKEVASDIAPDCTKQGFSWAMYNYLLNK